MKKASILSVMVFALAVCFTSCSKCYDCTFVVETETPNGIVYDTLTDNDFCTASQQELKDKEDEGYTCSSN